MAKRTWRVVVCTDCTDWIATKAFGRAAKKRCDLCQRTFERLMAPTHKVGDRGTCATCSAVIDRRGGRGMCSRCLQRARYQESKARGGKPCAVDGCANRIFKGSRLCDMHAHRLERHGDVGPAGRVIGFRGTTTYKIPEIRERVLAEQGGKCGLCELPIEAKDGHVDHDHSCCPPGDFCEKCMRSVLCRACNIGLGMFHDSPEELRRAADYVERFRN